VQQSYHNPSQGFFIRVLTSARFRVVLWLCGTALLDPFCSPRRLQGPDIILFDLTAVIRATLFVVNQPSILMMMKGVVRLQYGNGLCYQLL
jgi:hypothetical protein